MALKLQSPLRQRVDFVEKLLSAGADENGNEIITENDDIFPADTFMKACNPVGLTMEDDQMDAGVCTAAEFSFHEKCLNLLTLAGSHVNSTTEDQKTLLVVAAQLGRSKCVDLLVKAGANLETKDLFGYTALFHACQQGHHECADVLIQAGADVNTTDTKGNTALIEAASFGREQCVRLLLRAGADVNRRNCSSHNALMALISHNCSKNIAMLLFAAGETLGSPTIKAEQWDYNAVRIPMPSFLRQKQTELYLKDLCREAIRKRLIDCDPHSHLFKKIPVLGLPNIIENYLLYNCSLQQ